ncbi:hypothetical protein C8Q79DRAFT_966065 [Trametes meyenii]|nr:hypothetical protein C8Q79DRAFT_966065 [Trametes meyenii]
MALVGLYTALLAFNVAAWWSLIRLSFASALLPHPPFPKDGSSTISTSCPPPSHQKSELRTVQSASFIKPRRI